MSATISRNILVVEDSRMINHLLQEQLTAFGHNVISAYSLAEATEALHNNPFDFVILDLILPDGNGKELLRDIKKYPQTKVIILSGNHNDVERNKLFNEGIVDYYCKDSTIKHSISEINHQMQQLEYNKNFTILLIDDSVTIRTHLKILLQPRNFTILEASTGVQGLELLKHEKIDLIILDMELPDIHGLKVLEKIKSGVNAALPVIVVSGSNAPEVIRGTYKLGAAEYLHKPYIPEELLLKVSYRLEQYVAKKKLDSSNRLLQEYKDTIDESSIVSKADINGIITFVNPAFCTISGYSEDEVIGKSNNIVRHSDMAKEMYADMWATIQAKKMWRGILKNRKKGGTHYWVNTIIRPIINLDGNIIEYIGISTDITEIQDIKERLSKDLNITSMYFQDAYHLSKVYENAMDESSILSRMDTHGRITYVNSELERVTGYTEMELIGQNYTILKHPDNDQTLLDGIWETIQSGNIWKGLIKNRKKDGGYFWSNSVILPIKDQNEKIFEYMAIRNDVSEIIELHAEIENTQKELIYRMGELAESRSKETGNHIKRVAAYSKVLALKYGLSQKDAELLFIASPMHDIGKLSIPDAVLKKPGSLDKSESEIMKQHCQIGYDLLQNSNKPILKASAIVAYEHHEKWDGTGYPQKLKGEEIHIFARITTIADVFDALGSDRCYKKAWEDEKIFQLFRDLKGEHFDPTLVEIFFENIDELMQIRETYRDTFS
jgi:PAS domain S-box-containing protein